MADQCSDVRTDRSVSHCVSRTLNRPCNLPLPPPLSSLSLQVHANAVVLFGGKLVVDHVNAAVTLDGWLSLGVPARTAVMIKELRLQLEKLLGDKVQRPQLDLTKEAGPLVKAVVLLLKENAPPK
jgi:hypothetical protein